MKKIIGLLVGLLLIVSCGSGKLTDDQFEKIVREDLIKVQEGKMGSNEWNKELVSLIKRLDTKGEVYAVLRDHKAYKLFELEVNKTIDSNEWMTPGAAYYEHKSVNEKVYKLMEKYDPAKVVFTEKEWSEAKTNTINVMLAPRFGGFTENVSSLVFPEEGYQEATLQELFPKEYK